MPTFKALLITNHEGKIAASFEQLDRAALPPGDVLVKVAHSSLNYKDGLAVTGKPGVIRKYPMVPGIDFAGTVEESSAGEFKPGDPVVVTGCGTSETMWGGYAELARLDAEYIVPLPDGMTLRQAMGIGTAGFTAMQSVMALERHGLTPDGWKPDAAKPHGSKPGIRDVLVTGAAGGVGSVSIAILAKLGYRVVASTGRAELHAYLRGLGAAEILDRAVLSGPFEELARATEPRSGETPRAPASLEGLAGPVRASKRPLGSARWAGAIDSVGGDTLAGILRSVAHGGSVAACGLAGSAALNTTVFPFILRGVNLLGIDSSRTPGAERHEVWTRLRRDLPLNLLDQMIQVEPLDQVFELGERILRGKIRGRTVIRVTD